MDKQYKKESTKWEENKNNESLKKWIKTQVSVMTF